MSTQLSQAQTAQQSNRNADGTYAHGTHAEPAVRLFDTHRGGTFYHPTPPSTAKACIEFWSSVDAPDEAVSRFASGLQQQHAQRLSKAIEAEIEARRVLWETSNPMPKKAKDIEKWKGAYAEVYSRDMKEVAGWSDEELVPGLPHRFDHQQLARVAQMVTYGPNGQRQQEEFQKLIHTHVEFYDGPMTVREAWQKHNLGALQHLLEYRDGTEDLAGRLDGVKDAVRKSAESTEQMWRLDNGGHN